MLSRLIKIIKEILMSVQFIRFGLVGTSGLVLDFFLLIALTELLHLHYLISATVAFVVANLSNFILNKFWTFQNSSHRYARQYIYFMLAGVIGLLLTTLILFSAVEWLHFHYLSAKIVAVLLVMIWNYLVSKYLIFAR
jgi:putative flippase GtrA